MKKVFLSLVAIVLLSCSSDYDVQEVHVIDNPIKQSEIVGVWTDGDYFMSFNDNQYFAAYLKNDYFESGLCRYDITDGVENPKISISSNGFNEKSSFQIIKHNDSVLVIKMLEPNTFSQTLHKSDIMPTSENHILYGKSYNSRWSNTDTTTVRTQFVNGNTAIRTSQHKDANCPLYLRYFIYGDRLYFKTYAHEIGKQIAESDWGGMLNKGVSIWELTFNLVEEISSHKVIR